MNRKTWHNMPSNKLWDEYCRIMGYRLQLWPRRYRRDNYGNLYLSLPQMGPKL